MVNLKHRIRKSPHLRAITVMAPIRFLSTVENLFSHRSFTLTFIHPLSESSPTTTTSSLEKRQTIVVIPATYSGLNAGPPPGEVIGIVLGVVGGILLLLWLVYTALNAGRGTVNTSDVVSEQVVRRGSRSPRRQSVSRSEVIEVRTPPRRREERRETTVIREERRPVEREDDIVEVIEERSPSRSRSRSPPRRQRSNRESGYRTVDPEAFAGGGRPLRKVSRR